MYRLKLKVIKYQICSDECFCHHVTVDPIRTLHAVDTQVSNSGPQKYDNTLAMLFVGSGQHSCRVIVYKHVDIFCCRIIDYTTVFLDTIFKR